MTSCKDAAPDIFKFMHSAYERHFCGDHIIQSAGVQQGDPLDPLLFCLSIHPLVVNVEIKLHIVLLG